MKSLEIIDDIIIQCEDKVEFQKDFLKANPKEKPNPIFERQLNGCKQIKQDLEVLDIIRKKRVDIGRFKAGWYISSTPHQLMKIYNRDCNYIDNELSIDEVIKLKQWWEEKDND